MKKLFSAAQFTPTEWDNAEQKAKFANHFVRFVEGGFKDTLFPKWFYKRLSLCFGHIAHYNQLGFYETWFANPRTQLAFINHTLRYPCYGQPAFTYCDVESALVRWLSQSDIPQTLANMVDGQIEMAERAELARLKSKYGEVSP